MGVLLTHIVRWIYKILAQTLLFFKHREALKYYKNYDKSLFKTERE